MLSLFYTFIATLLFFFDIITDNQYYLLPVLSIVLLFFFIFDILRRDYSFVIMASFFIFSIVLVGISNLYIEFGNYITEEARFGLQIGSTTSYIAISIWFLLIGKLVFNASDKIYIPIGKININPYLIFLFFLFFELSYLYLLISHGSPLLRGEERFTYWLDAPLFYQKLNLVFPLMFVLLGMLMAHHNKKSFNLISVFLISFYVILLIFFSEKFSGLILVLFNFSIGFFVVKFDKSNFKIGIKHFLILGIIMIALLVVVFVNMQVVYGYDTQQAFDRFISRVFGLQGHVWYGIVHEYRFENLDLGFRELFIDFDGDESNPTGLVALMWKIAPHDLVEHMRMSSIRFTMGWPAIVLATYGWLGVIVSTIISAVMTGIIFRFMYNAIVNTNYVALALLMVLYRGLTSAFLMGDLFTLYKSTTLVAVAGIFLLILVFFQQKSSKEKNV